MNLSNSLRLFVAADLVENQTATTDADQAHYLQHVMRQKVGDGIRIFNGRDGEWHGTIATLGKRSADITIREQLRPQKSEPDIWLCCAPIKKAHFDTMLEKATELGVAGLHPTLTARTQIREVNVERCRALVIEAAEQSERLNIPDIEKPITLTALAAKWPTDRQLIVCAEWGDATPVQTAFAAPEIKRAKKTAIITGPEGGFAAEELELLRKIPGALFVRLGPRILRADTAAIAALTCWQSMCGDWT